VRAERTKRAEASESVDIKCLEDVADSGGDGGLDEQHEGTGW
jgi:hypothetical protein